MGSKILLVDDRKRTGEADVKGWIFSKSTCKCKILGCWGLGGVLNLAPSALPTAQRKHPSMNFSFSMDLIELDSITSLVLSVGANLT